MSGNVSVKPTPIQRNTNDVAMELTRLHVHNFGVISTEDLEITYAKYFALARTLELNDLYLTKLVPEEIMNKL